MATWRPIPEAPPGGHMADSGRMKRECGTKGCGHALAWRRGGMEMGEGGCQRGSFYGLSLSRLIEWPPAIAWQ